MRKISLFLLFALLSPFTFAAEQNKLQMVSYFPVPYVAYNDVTVTQFCDVGLLNQCAMNVGPGSPTINNYALEVYQDPDKGTSNQLNSGITLVKNGRLNLNSSLAGSRIYSSRADVGLDAGLTSGTGEVSFEHLAHLSSVPAPRSVSGEVASRLLHLQMYPTRLKNDFPGCSEPVGWKRVKIGVSGGTVVENVVLTCGDGKGRGCNPEDKPLERERCGKCGYKTKHVWCGLDNLWHEEEWSVCTTVEPAKEVLCSEAGYGCGNKMTRAVDCNDSTGYWIVGGWNTSACWNKNCNGVDTSCSLGCGGYSCTPSCGTSASSGGERSGSCYAASGGRGPFTCASGCGQEGYSDSCDGQGAYWSACGEATGASVTTTPCGEGKTGGKTTTCDASCSGPINCKTTGECADVVVPEEPDPDPDPDPTPECANGETKGSQACGECNAGKQTTQKCVDGKWTSSLGSCEGAHKIPCVGESKETAPCFMGMRERVRTCTCGVWGPWGAWDDSGCKDKECSPTDADLCRDCGGSWNNATCKCDCGFYAGNSCRFVKDGPGPGRGCLCGNLWKKCR